MVLWQWINDYLPPYAEQITVNEEVERIEQTLNKFDQLVPEGFTELGQPKKYWGSTEGLDKLLCERYTFKCDNKSHTLDISQELSDKLKLTPKDNFCVKEEVLSRLPEEGGITINNEQEIFLKKSFTVENLEADINKLLDKIKELKREKGEGQGVVDNLQNLLGINNLNNLPTLLGGETLTSLLARPTLTQLNDLSREKDQELTTKNTQIANLTQQVNGLDNELQREQGWWDKWMNENSLRRDYSSENYLKLTNNDKGIDFYSYRSFYNSPAVLAIDPNKYYLNQNYLPDELYNVNNSNQHLKAWFIHAIKDIYAYYRDK